MLDAIIKFSIRNKLVVGLMTLLWVIWGVWNAMRLPIDAVPDITNNQVQIITVCPTLASQEVEQLVTFPIEQSIVNLPNIVETRSISRFGLSVVTVVFKEEVDVFLARQLVNEKLQDASTQIPMGVGTPELAPISTGIGEVYQYILRPTPEARDKYNAKDLRTMQDWIVARQLYGTPGVAEVNSFGGELKQYEVAVSPTRMRAMGVSITEILTALEKNNQNTGGAYIDRKPNAYFIRGVGMATSLDDIRNIAIKRSGQMPIFIHNVAEVRYGHAIRYGALSYNGEFEAVGGVVMMLKGENSNEVVKRVKEKIPIIQKSLPDDIVIEPFLDRSDLVNRAIHTVEKNLLEGALIVIFVLVLFLGNLRAGLIVASAIPLSLLFALGLMNVFGLSANLMSLGAIDFGLIVDGAVIIVEATLHHLGLRKSMHRLTQQEMDDEVFESASKIRSSAAFGEIIILIVYIPILTLAGVEGKMFTPMAKTVAFAILGALILSLTYIPMMCALFLSKKPVQETFSDRFMERLQRVYTPLLVKAIRIKRFMVAGAIITFIASLFIFRQLGGEFIPQLAEGDFAFHCILPQGSSLSQSIETSMQASRIIKEFDEVKMVVAKTGSAEVPTDPMPPEASDLVIVLKPIDEWTSGRTYEQLANDMIERLEVLPGVFFEQNQPIQMRFNELMTGIRQDVAVKIFGENLDSLAYYAAQVGEVVNQVKGTTDPQIERVSGLPQINVTYDRNRMGYYGLTVSEVNDVISTAFAGKVAGQIFENERRFDLVVRLDSSYRASIEDVENMMIPTPTGQQVPVGQVADVSYRFGPAQISREDGKRRIVIGFNVVGRDVQSVVHDIQEQLDSQIKLPSGYYFTYGGQFENLQEATNRLLIAVPISLLLIFLLLYFTFHSMKQAVLIFTAIPMSAIGGVIALVLRDMPFSISAGIGFIALFGVAVLNGIVLIGTFNQLGKEGMIDPLERVIEGTKIRLRPVLMTATVASLGFLPMAISTSAGAEVQKPLATVVIGGLVTATILTLFVLPLLYLMFENIKSKKHKLSVSTKIGLIALFFIINTGNSANAQLRLSTAEEAIERAIQGNHTLKARSLDLQAAKELINSSKELPKLELNTQMGQYNGMNFDRSYQVSQGIPFPGTIKARKQVLTAQVQQRETEQALSVQELKTQVRSYYYQLRYLQFNQAQLAQLDSIYQEFIRVAQLRFRTGDTKKVDVSTAQVRQGEIDLLSKQNQVLKRNVSVQLAALLGTNESIELSDITAYEPMNVSDWLDTVQISQHPGIQYWIETAKVANATKNAERVQGLPEFSLGYTNQSLIGTYPVNGVEQFYGASKRFHYGTLGVAIPLTFGATKSKMKALDLQREAALSEAKQLSTELEAELATALRQYHQDMEQYNYYRNDAIPNANEIISSAQVGYNAGDISYVEFLYALQTSTDIRLNFLKSIQQVNETAIRILAILNM